MSSAFISYSRKDQAVADFIAAELRNRNVDVFVDYQNLRTGNFMSQLGQEIKRREYFIVVVSPDSVLSDWVKAEVTWAFVNEKIIIPIWYKPTKLTKVFVLEGMEGVDFKRWEADGMMDEAIQKLARLMSLCLEPIKSEPVPKPMLSKNDVHKQEKDEAEFIDNIPPPSFAREDITSMFQSALAAQDTDPERALFLYQQVLEIDPDFMDGTIRVFVARQQEKTKPKRLEILEKRIESAKRQGRWAELRELAESMIEIDPDNEFALDQIQIVEKNAECEPVYEQAKIAAETGSRKAVNVLMKDIQDTCPDYGDPAGLLAGQPIIRDLLGFLHDSHTLMGHTGPITKVTFSNNGSMLATASTDRSVKIWSSSTGEMLRNLTEYTDSVKSILFSPDDKYLVSVSGTGRINLWSVDGWELIQTVNEGVVLYDAAFFPNENKLVTCGRSDLLYIRDVSQMSSLKKITARSLSTSTSLTIIQTIVTSLDSSNDGLFACSIYQESKSRSTSKSHSTNRPILDILSTIDSASQFSSAVRLWNIPRWDEVKFDKFEQSVTKIDKISLSCDGKYLITLGNHIDVWKVPRGWHYSKIGNSSAISDFALSPIDSSLLIYTVDGPNKCYLVYFDLNTKARVKVHFAHEKTINSVAMSRDGRFIATGSDDCLAKIWQL